MEIFNVKQQLEAVSNCSNRDDLLVLEREFRRKHYPNVLTKSKQFREKYQHEKELGKVLLLLEAVCHAEIEEYRQSSEIISSLYQQGEHLCIEDLLLLGELAFMSDLKLSRRILSSTIKKMEAKDEIDFDKMARGYLVLGETEENLGKIQRAIKYYKNGMMFYKKSKPADEQMPLFLNFKIGMLYSAFNKAEEAISHLKESLGFADHHPHYKVNSLVSIAKIHASQNEPEKAYSHLKEALTILNETPEQELMVVRSEALTEMAYYYFSKESYKEAIPYYKEGIKFHLLRPDQSPATLGMLYMQYAYCLEMEGQSRVVEASFNYEEGIKQLENSGHLELIESALVSVTSFFDKTNDKRKKRIYENKLMNLVNDKNVS